MKYKKAYIKDENGDCIGIIAYGKIDVAGEVSHFIRKGMHIATFFSKNIKLAKKSLDIHE
jgi:hypothetical protein